MKKSNLKILYTVWSWLYDILEKNHENSTEIRDNVPFLLGVMVEEKLCLCWGKGEVQFYIIFKKSIETLNAVHTYNLGPQDTGRITLSFEASLGYIVAKTLPQKQKKQKQHKKT